MATSTSTSSSTSSSSTTSSSTTTTPESRVLSGNIVEEPLKGEIEVNNLWGDAI